MSKIKAAGVKVNNANKKAFIDASSGIYNEFSTTVPGGKELVTTAQGLAR